MARELKRIDAITAKDKRTCRLCIGKRYQRRKGRVHGRSYAGQLSVLLLVQVLMKLSSLLLYHAPRINTSFASSSSINSPPARKFQCKVTKPFSPPQYKRKKVVWIHETILSQACNNTNNTYTLTK